MIPTMILLFVVGYLFIALEHKTRIDKSAVALLMAGAIWTGSASWATTRTSSTSWRTSWATRAKSWSS